MRASSSLAGDPRAIASPESESMAAGPRQAPTLVLSRSKLRWRCELAGFALLLALFNLPLPGGQTSASLMFHPAPVGAGEWWRLFSHPFVHVSSYHFLLDAAAFFLAYAELRGQRLADRVLAVIVSGAGSLGTALLLAAPAVQSHGLCGLSGIAHGLTALVALQLFQSTTDRMLRLAGLACFVGVVAKCVVEGVTGQILFTTWHVGALGTPIAVCHGGGLLGALLLWMARSRDRKTVGAS